MPPSLPVFRRRHLVALSLAPWLSGTAVAGETTVAAAANLQSTLEEIAAQFRTDTGRSLRFVFGSSGQFTRQIEQGAPFDLFIAADEQFPLRLAERGLTRDKGVVYAIGRLALVTAKSSGVKADGEMAGVTEALKQGRLRHFAIANPALAPYGERAQQALQQAGLWQDLQSRLVLGENVGQALQFVQSGNAEAGLVAYSLTFSPAVQQAVAVAIVSAHLHAPLYQRMVLLKNPSDTARAFYDYLLQPKARALLQQHGYALP